MPVGEVGTLVRQYRRELGFVLEACQQADVDVDVAVRDGERIEMRSLQQRHPDMPLEVGVQAIHHALHVQAQNVIVVGDATLEDDLVELPRLAPDTLLVLAHRLGHLAAGVGYDGDGSRAGAGEQPRCAAQPPLCRPTSHWLS